MTGIPAAGAERCLVVKGSSGLGNRMLCVLTGILYARLAGRRLIVDWSDVVYSPDGSDVFQRFFVCPSAGPPDDIPETDSVAPDVWRGQLRDSVWAVQARYNRRPRERLYRALVRARVIRKASRRARLQRRFSIDVASPMVEADVAILWNYTERIDQLRPHFRGEFAGLGQMSTQAILTDLLRRELLLHPRIQARVDEFRAAHLDRPTVGVHLRLSDRRVRADAILEELDRLLRHRPDLTVFAATDNVDARELLERRYPGVVTTPHWYPAPGKSQHNNAECPDRVENGVEALVDLYLLGGCDYLIGDRKSSFTRVAALLRSGPAERFTDVRVPTKRRVRLARPSRHRRPPPERGRQEGASVA